jgi:hypothetical protein
MLSRIVIRATETIDNRNAAPTMTENRYSMSFTAGALLYRESLKVTRLYEEVDDWQAVRAQVMDDNLLQMRTLSAAKRVFREVASRLKRLTPAELTLLRTGTRQEQNHLLWLAICKRYRFIYDFAVEVVREKFIRLDFDLTYDAYEIFFNNKAEWHPEVEGIAESTRKKLRQVLFKMMREANLLSSDNQILTAMLTPREIDVIAADSPSYLLAFPISPTEVQEWLS